MILSPGGRCLESSSNHGSRTFLPYQQESLQCLLGLLRLSRTGGGARPQTVRGSMKLSSSTLPSRIPTRRTTSSRSPPTGLPSSSATLWNSHLPAGHVLPSPASSPCAHFSMDVLILPRPKPSAI